MRRFYHMHTRTRSIYNCSRSADLCVCASYIVSFQHVHLYIRKKKLRISKKETRQRTLSNKLQRWLWFTSLLWVINYWRMERKKKWEKVIIWFLLISILLFYMFIIKIKWIISPNAYDNQNSKWRLIQCKLAFTPFYSLNMW